MKVQQEFRVTRDPIRGYPPRHGSVIRGYPKATVRFRVANLGTRPVFEGSDFVGTRPAP